jgi:uncharacterized protein YhaN
MIPGLALAAAGYFLYPWLLPVGILCTVLGLAAGVILGVHRKKAHNAVPAVCRLYGVDTEKQLWELYDSYAAAWEMAQASVRLAKQVRQEAEIARQEQKDIRSQVVARLSGEGQSDSAHRQLSHAMQALREEQAMWKARLEAMGDPLVLTSRQHELTAEKEQLQQQLSALELAYEELEQANETLRAEFSPRLTQRAAYWMSRLTNGRYSEMTLNRRLDAMVRRPEELMAHESSFLSQGTRDQLYLAIRLALCELVLPTEDPCPIVLDDALVAFDDERLGYAMEALLELSEKRQIILFTCQHREEEYMKNRIRGGEQ